MTVVPAQPWLLFDIDGTLVDSSRLIVDVWRCVAAEFGADADAILAVCHGRRDSEVVPLFFRDSDRERVLARIQELEASGADSVRPMPGARQLVGGLSTDRWAAVTSGPNGLMAGRLKGAGLPIPPVLIGADDVVNGKPDPEGFLTAAVTLGADPARCVVVEDAPAGVTAGRRAGMFVVAVTTTHSAAELADADAVVAGLPDLDAVLGSRSPIRRTTA